MVYLPIDESTIDTKGGLGGMAQRVAAEKNSQYGLKTFSTKRKKQ
jgi:hypothetical protein